MEGPDVVSIGEASLLKGAAMTLPSTDYRLIPLTRGQFTKVDAADYEWLNQWPWLARWNAHTKSFYAQRSVSVGGGKQYTTQMGRLILGLEKGDKRQGDHVNHDTLDNRRSNLRVATSHEQSWNRRRKANCTSGHKGVKTTSKASTWMANIMVKGKNVYLGTRKTKEEALALYREASLKYHGEFGKAD